MEMWAPKAFTLEEMSYLTVPGIGTEADGNRPGQYQFVSVSARKRDQLWALSTERWY